MNANISKREAALVLSYRAGDTTAWDTLCLEYEKRLAQFFYNEGIHNREDVEDLVQDTLLEAMEANCDYRKQLVNLYLRISNLRIS